MDERADFETRAVLPPRRRRGNLLGIGVAALVVAVVVGGGFLGGRTPPLTPVDPKASDAVAVASPIESSAGLEPATRATLAPLPRYPAAVLGLSVWTATYAATYGSDTSGPVAVAGWFAAEAGTGCPTPRVAEDPAIAQEFGVAADSDTFCDRAGRLFTAPAFAEPVAPLNVVLTPGVAAPYELKDEAAVTPVVFVGRLTHPNRRCRASGGCPPVLVVDRVAWAGGLGLPRSASVLPKLLAYWPPLGSPARDRLVVKAIGDGDVLMDTLVDPATLARIDPTAARLLASAAPATDRIWYRRALGEDPAVDAVRWVAIDDATGNVIGSGPVEAEAALPIYRPTA